MPNEATIKIHRRWNLAGAIRPFTLVADDQKIGKISNGKTESFNIAPGNRTIFVRGALWARTEKIDIYLNPGEIKSFECGIPQSYWIWLGFIMIVLACQHFLIHSIYETYSIIFLPMTFLLVVTVAILCAFKPGFVYYLKEAQELP